MRDVLAARRSLSFYARPLPRVGCRAIIIALFAVVLLLGAAGAALYHYLGWYSLLAIPLACIALYVIVRFFAIRIFLLPFQLKGKVLKGARAEIHEVCYLGVEEIDVPGEEEQKEKQYAYTVDLTIKPSGLAATPFKMWDPYELVPVAPDSKVSFKEDPTDGSFGSIVEVSVFEDGGWQTEDIDKLQGAWRIRLKMHLVKPSAACKIRYYFYDVADVALPLESQMT